MFVSLSEESVDVWDENKEESEEIRIPMEFPRENASTTCLLLFVFWTTQTETSNAIATDAMALSRNTILCSFVYENPGVVL